MDDHATEPVKFSVIIATKDRRELVTEAVRSVVEQSYLAHEIIVVSDGSEDGTVESLRERFPSVKVIHQANHGESAARNAGIAEASGDWFGFLDDDDLWHRNKLRFAAEYILRRPECAAINNPHWYFSPSAEGPGSRLAVGRDFVAADLEQCHRIATERGLEAPEAASWLRTRGDSYNLMMERSRGVFSSTLVRRDVLFRAGLFMPNASYGEDWLMFVNVARFCEWHTLPYRLGFTRMHGVQQTGSAAMGGLQSLAGFIAMWYLGRPKPHSVSDADFGGELARFGPVYRRIVQGFVHHALKQRRLGRAIRLFCMGVSLLPRWRDRLYVWLPRPITWRWDRRYGHLPKGKADETGRWPALYETRTEATA